MHSPKFYLFDNGVRRALEGSLGEEALPRTGSYGELFESFVIQEIHRLNEYFEKDYRLSFCATKNGAEVDLVLSKGKRAALVEIKSSNRIDETEVRKLARIRDEFGSGTQAYYLSQDSESHVEDGIQCLSWREFIGRFKHLMP